MHESYRAVKLTDRVYWVGAIDWAIRDFHGYGTTRGTTYNAYLVLADKVTLIDTVKAPFHQEMMARIASVIEPAEINTIVSNHSEMDHSGCLPQMIEAVRPERVFASLFGVKHLEAHFHMKGGITPVKDGEAVSLGNMNLTFLETRMLHWPDSMIAYLAEEGILFSQDGFGQHLATSERFADELPEDVLRYEAAKYYANILMPFSAVVTKILARLAGMNLPLKIIAPDHGPVYRKNVNWIIDLWREWAALKPTTKAVIVYDTMWQSTARMAEVVVEGLLAGGATSVKVMPARESTRSDIATELLEAGALLVGSPTLNNQMFPPLADVLCYLAGLRRLNLVGAAFGSYGWSGEAVPHIENALRAMKVDLAAEGLKTFYVPDEAALAQCRALGWKVGAALKEHCSPKAAEPGA